MTGAAFIEPQNWRPFGGREALAGIDFGDFFTR